MVSLGGKESVFALRLSRFCVGVILFGITCPFSYFCCLNTLLFLEILNSKHTEKIFEAIYSTLILATGSEEKEKDT